MKSIAFFFCLFFLFFTSNAQEKIKNSDLTNSLELLPTSQPNQFIYGIKESYSGEFLKNPEDFLEKKIDINDLKDKIYNSNYDEYWVSIVCRKGTLKAKYSKEGVLNRVTQKFKNIIVPKEISKELYEKHRGWEMVKNKYRSTKNFKGVSKATYVIKLKKGRERKTIKISPNVNHSTRFAGN